MSTVNLRDTGTTFNLIMYLYVMARFKGGGGEMVCVCVTSHLRNQAKANSEVKRSEERRRRISPRRSTFVSKPGETASSSVYSDQDARCGCAEQTPEPVTPFLFSQTALGLCVCVF